MKTYVTGSRPPLLELVRAGLGSCEEWRGSRPPFVPAWRGLSGSGALGKLRAAGSLRSLSDFYLSLV